MDKGRVGITVSKVGLLFLVFVLLIISFVVWVSHLDFTKSTNYSDCKVTNISAHTVVIICKV